MMKAIGRFDVNDFDESASCPSVPVVQVFQPPWRQISMRAGRSGSHSGPEQEIVGVSLVPWAATMRRLVVDVTTLSPRSVNPPQRNAVRMVVVSSAVAGLIAGTDATRQTSRDATIG